MRIDKTKNKQQWFGFAVGIIFTLVMMAIFSPVFYQAESHSGPRKFSELEKRGIDFRQIVHDYSMEKAREKEFDTALEIHELLTLQSPFAFDASNNIFLAERLIEAGREGDALELYRELYWAQLSDKFGFSDESSLAQYAETAAEFGTERDRLIIENIIGRKIKDATTKVDEQLMEDVREYLEQSGS